MHRYLAGCMDLGSMHPMCASERILNFGHCTHFNDRSACEAPNSMIYFPVMSSLCARLYKRFPCGGQSNSMIDTLAVYIIDRYPTMGRLCTHLDDRLDTRHNGQIMYPPFPLQDNLPCPMSQNSCHMSLG